MLQALASLLLVAPMTYILDPNESLLYAQVWKDRDAPLAHLAHDHVVRAGRWTGVATLDPDDLEGCSIDIQLEVAALVPDETPMREHVGYTQMLDDGQREGVRQNLLGAGQLHAAAYPTLRFRSVRCLRARPEEATIDGELTVRGRTRAIPIGVRFRLAEGMLQAQGMFAFLHRDFGFEPYTAMLGALRNRDPIEVSFSVTGHPEARAHNGEVRND
jgi:polyisoprenoid-binding protein YceI